MLFVHWCVEKLIDQSIASIQGQVAEWQMLYLTWREFGGASLFGETCLSHMTACQLRLVTQSHYYDVIRSTLAGSSDKKTSFPTDKLPYPTELHNWYNKWRAKQTSKPSSVPKAGGNRISMVDEEQPKHRLPLNFNGE